MESEHSLVGGLNWNAMYADKTAITLPNGSSILTEFGDDPQRLNTCAWQPTPRTNGVPPSRFRLCGSALGGIRPKATAKPAVSSSSAWLRCSCTPPGGPMKEP